MASKRKTPKEIHACADGPFKGHEIALTATCDKRTAWFRVGDHVGRYVVKSHGGRVFHAHWERAAA
jgi:hypothetical protein